MATPLFLYSGFLDKFKTNVSRILTTRARYPQDPSTIPIRSCPWILPGSPMSYSAGWGGGAECTRHRSPVPIYTLGLDKSIFPRILTPRWAKGQQHPQLALGPVAELWLRGRPPVVRTTFSHMATALVLYPGFLHKMNSPRTLTLRARYHRALLIPTLSRPWTLPGSPVAYRCWGHQEQASCAYVHPWSR